MKGTVFNNSTSLAMKLARHFVLSLVQQKAIVEVLVLKGCTEFCLRQQFVLYCSGGSCWYGYGGSNRWMGHPVMGLHVRFD